MESGLDQLTTTMHELRISSSEVKELQHHFPHEVLADQILSRLPIKSLLRFKSVSKLWYATISTSYHFANTHFKSCPFSQPSSPSQCIFIQSGHDYYLHCHDDDDDNEIVTYYGRKGLIKLKRDFDVELEKLSLVGSCNGLVCLAASSGDLIIWNPITQKSRKITDPYLTKSCNVRNVSWGFGNTSSTANDYKVVRIVELPKTLEIVVHVFSLTTNEWRRIDDECYKHLLSLGTETGALTKYFDGQPFHFLLPAFRGVLVDETLHWIVHRTEATQRSIITFDLNLEWFDEFPHLDLRWTEYYWDEFLCVMGGCLSTYGANIHDDEYINVLRSPGVKDSMFLFRRLELRCKDLVGFTKSGKFFITKRYSNEVGLVDPRLSPMKYTKLVSLGGSSDIHIINHVPSLISPVSISSY